MAGPPGNAGCSGHDEAQQVYSFDRMVEACSCRVERNESIIADPVNIDTTAAYVSAAAARDGSLFVAYIPPAHKGGITVDLSVLNKPGFVYWFDPTDGSYSP